MANPNFTATLSTNDLYYDLDTSVCLTDMLDEYGADIDALELAIGNGCNYADANHNHDDRYYTESEVDSKLAGKSDSNHTHSGYASLVHAHTGEYDAAGAAASALTSANAYTDAEIADLLNNSTAAVDSIMELADAMQDNADAIEALETIAAGKANASHTHAISDVTNLQSTLDGKAATSHTHSNYAASNHSHSNYAASSHTHDYLPLSGGIVNGNVNVAGVLKVQGQQAFYYASGTASQTIGTNNATGGTTICCGSDATVNVNGATMKTSTVVPKSTNTYYCGNSNYRWKGIYSAAAVNVSSDERLKENIESIDNDEAVKLVNQIDVKSFNYIDDDEPQIGVIAQDIIEISPEIAQAIVIQGEDGYYGVKTSDLVFPLIVAVQKLTKEVEELKAQLA